jgi:N-acetylglucosamine kinase-like BadF-type ATPase
LATFCSATHREAGYAIVAGTGASAIRAEGGKAAATADGLGWLLGDVGSGFWIGHRVVHAAMADLDHRGPATALTEMLLRELDAADVGTTLDANGREARLTFATEALYAIRPVELAQFAHLAFDASEDPIAASIVRGAASGLVETFEAVRRPDLAGPRVLGGGILTHYPILVEHMTPAIARDGLAPEFRPVPDGVVGAAVLALRESDVTVDQTVFDTLIATLAALR